MKYNPGGGNVWRTWLLGAACLGLVTTSSLPAQQIKLRTVFKGHSAPVFCVAISSDSKLLPSGGGGSALVGGLGFAANLQTSELKLWDIETGMEKATLVLEKGGGFQATDAGSPFSGVTFSKDCKLLASARMEGVKLWDVAAEKERATFKHTGPVSSVAFSGDGKLLATGTGRRDAKGKSLTGEVKVWDMATGKEKTNLKHTGFVSSVAFSSDGKLVAAGSGGLFAGDGTVKLWDVATANERATFKGHTGGVALSADGKLLASGSAEVDEEGKRLLGEVKLWDVTTGKEKATFKHTGLLSSLALSDDGKLLATGSIGLDATKKPQSQVTLWDVVAGKEIATLEHTDFVWSVALSGDGKLLASGSGDIGLGGGIGTVKLWDILLVKKAED